MPALTSQPGRKVRAKPSSKKPAPKTEADKIRALEEQLAQREAERAVINSIQTALASKLDFQGIIDAVGDKLSEIFDDGNVGIGFLDKARNVVNFPYVVENGKRIEYFEISLDQPSVLSHTVKRRRPFVINTKLSQRFGTGTFNFPGLDQRDLKSWLSVPILHGDKIIGGISLRSWQRENAYNESSVRLLQTIANSMSVALENVRLFEETQRLLKETEQRATELQIINNIGQTLTEGLDLDSTLERVGERLREALNIKSLGIVAFDPQVGSVISNYFYHYGRRFTPQRFSMSNYKFSMRFASRVGYKPWVVNTNVERYWKKFGTDILTEWTEIPKAFVMVPMLAGRQLVGSITIADYENENAFTDLPVGLLETIASNMGTAIQNVRLLDETQRLLKQTEQRATELHIINTVGQTLNEGYDLNATLEHVGERLRTLLQMDDFGITAFDPTEKGLAIYHYVVRNGNKVTPENFSLSKYRLGMRLAARRGGRPWVVNENAAKYWEKIGSATGRNETPKSFVMLPMVADMELVGSITLADFERENAFLDLPMGMLETIASNMGTAIQNVRLFEETQRLLKQTRQRAAELQIINEIGQVLTEGLDLNTMIEHVGDTLREALDLGNIRIAVVDEKTGLLISPYVYHHGKRIAFEEYWQNKSVRYKLLIRASAKTGTRSWVVNTHAEKAWKKYAIEVDEKDIPKSFITLLLWAGKEVIGGIIIPDYEKENAFTDFSIGMLETIASNMGTAIQNARLFDQTIRLFEEAQEARASAERANKAKSTFLANMSHELRTPLNAIMGFTRIVKNKSEDILPDKQIENLDKVLISSNHLLGLINTVLDIAKIEAGRMDVIPDTFSLSELADQCVTLATPLLKPNVTLEKQVDETIGFIFSDPDKIKQIVLNLLSNAVKFTHKGRILLSVEKVNEEIVSISVTDSGIGISEEALGHIFEEFQQADNTTTRQYGGTGLGLTISRNLARLLGGDLTVTSEVGKGSTFSLTIAVRYGKKPSASSDPKSDSAESAESQSDSLIAAKKNGSRGSLKTILIVEDTELNINLLTQLLEEEYNLLVARDGEQGIRMAQEKKPDLILMDVSLPLLNGYEATRGIRATMKSVPIIGLSANAMSGDEGRAKEAGCDDYLTKPLDAVLLIKKLNQYLRR